MTADDESRLFRFTIKHSVLLMVQWESCRCCTHMCFRDGSGGAAPMIVAPYTTRSGEVRR